MCNKIPSHCIFSSCLVVPHESNINKRTLILFCPINNFDAYFSHSKHEIINDLAVWSFLRNILISYVACPMSSHFLELLLNCFPIEYSSALWLETRPFPCSTLLEVEDASGGSNFLMAYMTKYRGVTHIQIDVLSYFPGTLSGQCF